MVATSHVRLLMSIQNVASISKDIILKLYLTLNMHKLLLATDLQSIYLDPKLFAYRVMIL